MDTYHVKQEFYFVQWQFTETPKLNEMMKCLGM